MYPVALSYSASISPAKNFTFTHICTLRLKKAKTRGAEKAIKGIKREREGRIEEGTSTHPCDKTFLLWPFFPSMNEMGGERSTGIYRKDVVRRRMNSFMGSICLFYIY